MRCVVWSSRFIAFPWDATHRVRSMLKWSTRANVSVVGEYRPDSVEASAHAFLEAINRIIAIQEATKARQ